MLLLRTVLLIVLSCFARVCGEENGFNSPESLLEGVPFPTYHPNPPCDPPVKEEVVYIDESFDPPYIFILDDKPPISAIANLFPLSGELSGGEYNGKKNLGIALSDEMASFLFNELSRIVANDPSQPPLKKDGNDLVYDSLHVLGTGDWRINGKGYELGNHSFTIKEIVWMYERFKIERGFRAVKIWGAIADSPAITQTLKDKGFPERDRFYILIGYQELFDVHW